MDRVNYGEDQSYALYLGTVWPIGESFIHLFIQFRVRVRERERERAGGEKGRDGDMERCWNGETALPVIQIAFISMGKIHYLFVCLSEKSTDELLINKMLANADQSTVCIQCINKQKQTALRVNAIRKMFASYSCEMWNGLWFLSTPGKVQQQRQRQWQCGSGSNSSHARSTMQCDIVTQLPL